jgi:hypothetical protein
MSDPRRRRLNAEMAKVYVMADFEGKAVRVRSARSSLLLVRGA